MREIRIALRALPTITSSCLGFFTVLPLFLVLLLHAGTTVAEPLTAENFSSRFVAAAIERTQHSVRYDGSYHRLDYPGGDVPAAIGVCTDVLIRAYRRLGIDLQLLVHEDMREHFAAYPSQRIWGLTRPDRNIDHRRVPNLQTFFTRHGQSLPVSNNPRDYQPGDIVSWMLPGNLPHIGIVTDKRSETAQGPLIVHNIGSGPQLEDQLFAYPITGHYRYHPLPQD